MLRNLVSLLFLIICLQNLFAHCEDYCPFGKEHPKPFPLKKYNNEDNGLPIVKLYFYEGTQIELINRNDEKMLLHTEGTGAGNAGFDGVYVADINNDGYKDFIVFCHSGGCGLSGCIGEAILIMGGEAGYKVLRYSGSFIGINDFLDIDEDGKAEILITEFRYGLVGRDKQRHNYWIYNLYRFDGTNLRPTRGSDNKFPVHIWYTYKENHKPTTQLTKEQKLLWDWAGEKPIITGSIEGFEFKNANYNSETEEVLFIEVRDSASNIRKYKCRPNYYGFGTLIDKNEEPNWFRAFRKEDYNRLLRKGRKIEIWDVEKDGEIITGKGWEIPILRISD